MKSETPSSRMDTVKLPPAENAGESLADKVARLENAEAVSDSERMLRRLPREASQAADANRILEASAAQEADIAGIREWQENQAAIDRIQAEIRARNEALTPSQRAEIDETPTGMLPPKKG